MMPRRALIPGDEVAAVEHPRRHQGHLADRLDPEAAIRSGVLLPHRKYVVVWSGRKTAAPTSPRELLVGLPGDDGTKGGNAVPRATVRPSEVRLWTNPKERRRRALAQVAAKLAVGGAR